MQVAVAPPGIAWATRICSDCGRLRRMPVSSEVCMRCAESGVESDERNTFYLPSLRDLRERSGFTPAELAERAGIAAGTIHGLERGAWRARIGTAERLAEALDVEVTDLTKEERSSRENNER